MQINLNNLFSNFKAVVVGGIVSIVLIVFGFFIYSAMTQTIVTGEGRNILAGDIFADLNEFKRRNVTFNNLSNMIDSTFDALRDTRIIVNSGSSFYKPNPFSPY